MSSFLLCIITNLVAQNLVQQLDKSIIVIIIFIYFFDVLNIVPLPYSVFLQKWMSSPPAAARRWRRLRVLGSFTPAPGRPNSETSTVRTSRISLQASSLERSWRKDGCQEMVNTTL